MKNFKEISSAYTIETKIGKMLAVASKHEICFLRFLDDHQDEAALNIEITEKITDPIKSISSELALYFDGKLQTFTTPINTNGTAFQELVWHTLVNIPYGRTISYAEQAFAMGRQKSFRAVAKANSANPIAIVIPCHRVIKSDGSMGGYNAGVARKQWLLNHEKSCLMF